MHKYKVSGSGGGDRDVGDLKPFAPMKLFI